MLLRAHLELAGDSKGKPPTDGKSVAWPLGAKLIGFIEEPIVKAHLAIAAFT